MRKTVVLPAPFGPTSPTFSPGFSWNDASTKRTWPPYALQTLLKVIMKLGSLAGPALRRIAPFGKLLATRDEFLKAASYSSSLKMRKPCIVVSYEACAPVSVRTTRARHAGKWYAALME